MPDVRRQRCLLIAESLAWIAECFQTISHAEDFMNSFEGRLRLDSITLRLQAVGENTKKIQAADPYFFESEIPFNVEEIVRFRDFISHHYEKLDYQVVFDTCLNDVPVFANAVNEYLQRPQTS